MNERKNYELPHPRRNKDGIWEPDFLPDYTTLRWESELGEHEAQVHPTRVDVFKSRQEDIEGKIEWKETKDF